MILYFGLIEIILIAIDVNYSDTPLLIQNVVKYNNHGGVIRFKKDQTQFWVPVRSFENTTPLKKPKGVKRIAALGDSCTQGCADANQWTWAHSYAYPGFLQDLLRTKMKDPGIEVLNASVGSYSSFQGLKRLEHVVLKYNPDLLTIYFGWNDHWLAAQEDKNIPSLSGFQVFLLNIMEKFRFFQFMHYLIDRMTHNTLEDSLRKKSAPEMRVGRPDYKKNLNAMIDLAQDRRIQVILITAPHDLKNWEPSPFFPFPRETLLEVHRAYNDVVRTTAKRRGVYLLDLERIVERQHSDKLISRDGIHLTSEGCRFIAEALAQKILDEKILSQ